MVERGISWRRIEIWLFGLCAFAWSCVCQAQASATPALEVTSTRVVEPGHYLDSNGRSVEFAPVYESWFGPNRYPLHPVRALLENSALLALEVAVYWSDPSSNIVDWQFPNIGTKLTSNEAFRFDDNLLATNYVFHPFAGTTHYVVTRSNGFGVLPSFAVAAGSSAIYELVLEWRELVSLNDLVVTPFGGIAMGEFFYQLGNYINSEPPSGNSHSGVGEGLHLGVRTTLGLPRDVHDAIDRPRVPVSVPRDNLGLSSAYYHRFRVLASEESLATGDDLRGPLVGWDASFELFAMPGFHKLGTFARSFSNGNFTSLTSRLLLAARAHDSELRLDSHLFGHYQQDLVGTPSGARGYANELALSVGLTYLTQSSFGQGDAYGIVHLLKPVERAWLLLGPVEFDFTAEAALDFASIHSLAYARYVELYGAEGTKSSLQRHGYAHTLGAYGAASAAMKAGGLELGVRGHAGRYESLDGAERFEEQVSREPHGTESMLRLAAYLRAEPPDSPFSGKLELTSDWRRSSLGSLEKQRRDVRFMSGLGLRF